MLPMVVFAAAMSFTPAQGGLNLSNDRITFGGQLGATRPDNRYLPGDQFYLVFDIEGLRADQQGRVNYVMNMVLVDATGVVKFETKPAEQSAVLPLGASKLPARAFVFLGLDLKGKHTCRVTVSDKTTGATKTIEKVIEVLPPAFGIVCFHTSYDSEAKIPAPQAGFPGQSIWLHFVTVGFTRDPNTKQPYNVVEMRITDSAGRMTSEKPYLFEIKSEVKEDDAGLDWYLPLPLNQSGSYTVELKATDKLNGKEYKISFPLAVYQAIK